jgi:hypothetical protein
MRRMLLVVVVAAMAGIASCYVATGGMVLRTSAIRVRAIDAVTQRPVAGAVLAAQWQTSAFLCIEGDCPRTIIRTAEAVSDSFGIAKIPAASVRRPGWRGFIRISLGSMSSRPATLQIRYDTELAF